MGLLSRKIFSLSTDAVRFDVRGFRGGRAPGVREHVETVGESFLAGYHAALEAPDPADLEPHLETVPRAYRGFAYEGAAMSLFLLDRLLPRRDRFAEFLAGCGDAHVYIAHVGAGWAMARLPFGLDRSMRRLDPLYRWLAMDGYGFHQGFFHWPQAVEGPRAVPRRLKGYARRAFDQGLGRSLWFVEGADVDRIVDTLGHFAPSRRGDLWSGLGLAATYAGGVDDATLEHLVARASEARPQLAQGSAFASKARERAGLLLDGTDRASRLLAGCSALDAAAACDDAIRDLPSDRPGEPAYEIWRQRLQERFGHLTADGRLGASA